MSTDFEIKVLEKLSSIEERITNIETKFDEATDFADGLMAEEGGVFGSDGLNTLRETFTSLLTPQAEVSGEEAPNFNPESLQDLVGSLKDFKERLSGIKSAIADLPDESLNV